jgi:hypothetical protein
MVRGNRSLRWQYRFPGHSFPGFIFRSYRKGRSFSTSWLRRRSLAPLTLKIAHPSKPRVLAHHSSGGRAVVDRFSAVWGAVVARSRFVGSMYYIF